MDDPVEHCMDADVQGTEAQPEEERQLEAVEPQTETQPAPPAETQPEVSWEKEKADLLASMEKEKAGLLAALKDERTKRREYQERVLQREVEDRPAARQETQQERKDRLAEMLKQYPDDPLIRSIAEDRDELKREIASLREELQSHDSLLSSSQKKEAANWLDGMQSTLKKEYPYLGAWEDQEKFNEFLLYASEREYYRNDETFRDGFRAFFMNDILEHEKSAAREDAVRVRDRAKNSPIGKGGAAAGVQSPRDSRLSDFQAKVKAEMDAKRT